MAMLKSELGRGLALCEPKALLWKHAHSRRLIQNRSQLESARARGARVRTYVCVRVRAHARVCVCVRAVVCVCPKARNAIDRLKGVGRKNNSIVACETG